MRIMFTLGYFAPAAVMFLTQCAFWYWIGTLLFR